MTAAAAVEVARVPGASFESTQLVTLDLPKTRASAATGWASTGAFPSLGRKGVQTVHASSIAVSTGNISQLRRLLKNAPLEFTAAAEASPVVLSVPAPDGTLRRFEVWRTVIMEPGLARKFKGIATYSGEAVGNSAERIQLDVTPAGFHAQVTGGDERAFYVDPLVVGNAKAYGSYWQRDAVMTDAESAVATQLGVQDSLENVVTAGGDGDEGSSNFSPPTSPAGQPVVLREFKLAVAANHLYVAAVGGTVALAQAAIVTMVNRTDGIFETDLGVRLTLVDGNSSVIYASAANDPYSNSGTAANVNTANLNSVLGSDAYDVGHVLTNGSYFGAPSSVGNPTTKGQSTSGLANPTGDLFFLEYFTQAIAKQFGATPTTNSSLDGARNATSAWEPGSGSTIMGDAGFDGTENLQAVDDPYFHGGSIAQVQTFLATIPTVGTSVATSDTAPTVSAGKSYVIPTGVPFALTATGGDADAGDTVTYTWEEMDLGAATNLFTGDNGASPLFRSFAPTTSVTRSFPQTSTVLAGLNNTLVPNTTNNSVSERLPTVARTAMKFRVTARDGHGGVAQSDVSLTVVASGTTPFAVTQPNTAVSWPMGTMQTVTWTPGITTGAAIGTTAVKISLSTDGGATYPYVLAGSVANTGTAVVAVPALSSISSQARVKVEAIGNIFYDVSNSNFTVAVPNSTGAPQLVNASDTGVSNMDKITSNNNSTPNRTLTFTIGSTLPNDVISLYAGSKLLLTTVATGTSVTVTTSGSTAIADGAIVFGATRQPSTSLLPSAVNGAVVTIDTTPPTATIAAVSPAVRNTAISSIALNFNEPVTAAGTGAVITLTSDGVPVPATGATVTGTNAAWSIGGLATLTTPTANYTMRYFGPSVVDLAGNAMVATTAQAAWAMNVITLPETTGTNTLRIGVDTTNVATVRLYVNNTGSTPDYTWTFASQQLLRVVGSSGADVITFNGPSVAYNAKIDLQIGGVGSDEIDVASGTFSTGSDPGSDVAVKVFSGAQVRFGVKSSIKSLDIAAGGTAVAVGALRVGALSIGTTSGAYTGVLDLQSNDLLWANGSESSVAAMLRAGVTTGVGIKASVAGTGTGRDKYAGLAGTLNTNGIGGTLRPTLDGWTATTSDVLVKYTYLGDTDLDGKVTPADLANLLAGMGGGLARWVDGDSDYDGVVTAGDEDRLLTSLKSQTTAFGL